MSTSSLAFGGHGHRSRLPRLITALTALLLAATVLAGCTTAGQGGGGGGGNTLCDDAFAMAAAIEADIASVTDLDPAIRRCRSLEEWTDAAADHPEALRGTTSEQHLEDRCGDPSAGLAGYQVCALLRAESATPAPRPTSRPTPKATRAPPWPARAWATFRDHYYKVESRGVNLMYLAVDGIQNSTFRRRGPAIGPIEGLRTWAVNELRWLDRHPPHRCYANVQRAWSKGVSYVAQAARLLVPGFRQASVPKLERGSVLLGQAGTWFGKAEDRFQKLGPNGCD